MKILEHYYGPVRKHCPNSLSHSYDYFGMERHYRELYLRVQVENQVLQYHQTFPEEVPYKEAMGYAKRTLGDELASRLFALAFQ